MQYKISLVCTAHLLYIKKCKDYPQNNFWLFLSQFKYLYDWNEQWLTGLKLFFSLQRHRIPRSAWWCGLPLCHLLLSRRNRELFCQREFLPKGWYLAFTVPIMMLNRAVGSALSTHVSRCSSFSTAYIFSWPFTPSHADSPTVSLWCILLPSTRQAYTEKSYT